MADHLRAGTYEVTADDRPVQGYSDRAAGHRGIIRRHGSPVRYVCDHTHKGPDSQREARKHADEAMAEWRREGTPDCPDENCAIRRAARRRPDRTEDQ